MRGNGITSYCLIKHSIYLIKYYANMSAKRNINLFDIDNYLYILSFFNEFQRNIPYYTYYNRYRVVLNNSYQ